MARTGTHKGFKICILFAGGRKILQHADSVGAKYLDLQLWSTFRNLSFGRIDTYFESCGILRKYVLRNSPQSKKLKGNLPIGQLVSHPSKKFHAVVGSCRGKHMVLTQLSSLLIHIRLVTIVIDCSFRIANKLRAIIDNIITLLVPCKECFM